MFLYTLRDNDQLILLQHGKNLTQEEFEKFVDVYRYDYKGEQHQNEYPLHEVAKDLESVGFRIVPSVTF